MRSLALVLLLLTAPLASAGTREAPELVDAAGDCAFAPANHYADIVAAWISDETAADFRVNLQIAEWVNDFAGSFVGYTVQFTHQDVQWGVAAFFDPINGWDFNTGFVDTQTGELEGFETAEGAFDASTLTMWVLFSKSLFPHDGNDNRLSAIHAATADFKALVPIFVAQGAGAPVPPVVPFAACDEATATMDYAFTVGQHAAHGETADANGTEVAAEIEPLAEAGAPSPAAPSEPSGADTPGPGLALALAAALLALVARRRRA